MCSSSVSFHSQQYGISLANLLEQVRVNMHVHRFKPVDRLLVDMIESIDPDDFRPLVIIHPLLSMICERLSRLSTAAVCPPDLLMSVFKTFNDGMIKIIEGCRKSDELSIFEGCLKVSEISCTYFKFVAQGAFLETAIKDWPIEGARIRREIEKSVMERMTKLKTEVK